MQHFTKLHFFKKTSFSALPSVLTDVPKAGKWAVNGIMILIADLGHGSRKLRVQ
jgi:hypothetical protein